MVTNADACIIQAKAKAAADWLVKSNSAENLQPQSAGYFPVHGTSRPSPPDNVARMLGYSLQALLGIQES